MAAPEDLEAVFELEGWTNDRITTELGGAWYAAFALETAHAEAAYHRGRELLEIGVADARLEMREYVADFSGAFHDIRADRRAFRRFHHPDDYGASQRLAADLLVRGSDGILYRSVRHAGGTCLACFRPRLAARVRIGGHYEYRWQGASGDPVSRRLDTV